MRQLPYRLLAALTITLTLGGCVTYPVAPPVIGGSTYVRAAPPVYSYSVITDPGYRYYDDTLGVYVFYDRSDVFYRQGHYYRWHQDHWISASHWRGPWYPARNLTFSVNFNDRWHTRLRRHGHYYAGGHHHRPPRRHGHDHGYKQRDRYDSKAYRHDRREKGWERREERQDRREERQDLGRDGVHGFAGVAKPKGRAFQADNRSGDRRNDRGYERRNPDRKLTKDERVVKVTDKPASSRGPRVVPAVERPAIDRRAVRDRSKPENHRGKPQRQRNVSDEQRAPAAKPAPRKEREQAKREQPKKKEKRSRKKADKRDQARRVREPLPRRTDGARRQID
ncbi:hypothetical protein [Microbulbifer sp. Q7]|uniref:hypothetical protein n=1 Tax=Microbulbifer sp. Q7 TaxID=1785091 RepID=UPI000B097556|nr:hypothetical protein [Microbulbifer sp. Q7]